MKRTLHLPLLPKILIAIALGIVCSLFFPVWAVRVFLTINGLFSNFLGLFIPLLIVGLIAPGIAELGQGAGRLLLITAGLAYLSTVLTGFFSLGVCKVVYPSLLGSSAASLAAVDMSGSLTPYFTVAMPAFLNVTSALVVAFILGLGTTAIASVSLKRGLTEFRDIVTVVITRVIIPVLPVYIFGIFLQMGAEGHVATVLGMFVRIILVIFAMHITVLVLQFCIAGAVARRNPFKALWTMLPAYVTALGTSSSAATIPVTLAQTKKNGVSAEVADFTVPLCATIHMPCSVLKIVACCYAVSLSMGAPVDVSTYGGFILMCSITMVAAPGVPGGAIMAALGLIGSALGFDANMQGIIIALYMAMDSFGTAGNVTGDGAMSIIIERINQNRKTNG